jgi:hypothetical protein
VKLKKERRSAGNVFWKVISWAKRGPVLVKSVRASRILFCTLKENSFFKPGSFYQDFNCIKQRKVFLP